MTCGTITVVRPGLTPLSASVVPEDQAGDLVVDAEFETVAQSEVASEVRVLVGGSVVASPTVTIVGPEGGSRITVPATSLPVGASQTVKVVTDEGETVAGTFTKEQVSVPEPPSGDPSPEPPSDDPSPEPPSGDPSPEPPSDDPSPEPPSGGPPSGGQTGLPLRAVGGGLVLVAGAAYLRSRESNGSN